ncbi:hypothetical protein QNI23_015670 [Bermanella sp. WJH001]|uniref:hypothetical protein n=1 Tax=Bermanella sp. WJH001 TaxID=3048005 RepID=UPI0024BEE9B1|nr:hypothetical protein [Bermanella sp. WJH001]MDJ1539121.1 hypothetical protein [Bermanella sp. WJH001]
MSLPATFYHHIYNWHDTQQDNWLNTLLKSCHHIMLCRNTQDVCEIISNIMLQLRLDGYYRLEVCDRITIEHFHAGKHATFSGEKPQKGAHIRSIKVVELEHAIIFKMQFVQLYLSKHQANSQQLENHKDIWLLWMTHIESLCLEVALQSFLNTKLSANHQRQADNLQIHQDLEMNHNQVVQQASHMYQNFNEAIMPLITPAEEIPANKRQQLLVDSLSEHQKRLSQLIQLQYGLYLSTERILQAIKTS